MLSIIYSERLAFVAEITEKPGAEEQNSVPVVGLTLRARDAEELTTYSKPSPGMWMCWKLWM